jgi:transcriptional regulator with XRE-family HTH domain
MATSPLVAQLRALRLERGLPLKVVAHNLGVGIWWLCQLEHGRGQAAARLERWAAALDADVAISPKHDTPKRRAG